MGNKIRRINHIDDKVIEKRCLSIINLLIINKRECVMKQLKKTILKRSFLFLVMAFIVLSGCQPQKPDPSQELKPIVDKYHDVWNGGN